MKNEGKIGVGGLIYICISRTKVIELFTEIARCVSEQES